MKVKKAVRSSLSDSRESANHCMSLQPKPSWYVQPIRYSWDVSPVKTSGFYIEKQQVLKGADAVQRICIR